MLKNYSTVILRLGLGIVLLWFGISTVSNTEQWSQLIPNWFPITATTTVLINGIYEIILGALLILGLFTRVVALLFAINLIMIISFLGYGPSATRDFGLLFAAISLAMSGSKILSLDNIIFKK